MTLVHDLLAIHMIRTPGSGTIISFHPRGSRSTAAEHLQSRIIDAGHSVYWADIFGNTRDPTFILLTYFWYALYAWDQALEKLCVRISILVSFRSVFSASSLTGFFVSGVEHY